VVNEKKILKEVKDLEIYFAIGHEKAMRLVAMLGDGAKTSPSTRKGINAETAAKILANRQRTRTKKRA
jgi:hypothetical protein